MSRIIETKLTLRDGTKIVSFETGGQVVTCPNGQRTAKHGKFDPTAVDFELINATVTELPEWWDLNTDPPRTHNELIRLINQGS